MIDGGCMLCDMRDLSQCALVNRQLSEAAQNLLYHNVRIDTVHYCEREVDLSAKRKRRSSIGRNGAPKDPPQERLHLFSRSVRENYSLACQVQYLKIPYMTREVCKADLARTVSVLPNLRYVDLPDGFYNDDPSSNTLRQELQARCGDIRQMKYAGGAEASFQMLAGARQWPNLEALELLHLAIPATIADVFASLKALRHIKFTSLQSLDDSIFSSLHMSPFPPLAVLEFQDVPKISAKGLLAYLSCPKVKQTLSSLTLANTGVLPSDLFQILAAAPSLITLRVAESVAHALPQSQSPPLASCSLRNLYYEIASADSSPRGLSSLSDSYYSYLSSSILSGALPSLSHLYALSTALPTMLLPPPQPAFAVNGTSKAYRPVTPVVSRPLRLYTKAVTEMEWNLTLISPPTLADRYATATTTRPMSLYLDNQLSPQWRDKGRESVMVGNGFGGFLAVPSEDPRSGSPKAKKDTRDLDAWMG
ncbi:hypothetical protein HO173_012545 [Letharia columbiana]|uniref:F-box domain-containing protein n=1 Tax=Letharia columbiana TaxID=112416 RepID=A0A8H6FF50_9LECA|nr:uncharacterized protein HO173_012545 [Letharia columbiana]KAF6226055.1 hypothetical protein HO173_012545 [Letharia columbiana]